MLTLPAIIGVLIGFMIYMSFFRNETEKEKAYTDYINNAKEEKSKVKFDEKNYDLIIEFLNEEILKFKEQLNKDKDRDSLIMGATIIFGLYGAAASALGEGIIGGTQWDNRGGLARLNTHFSNIKKFKKKYHSKEYIDYAKHSELSTFTSTKSSFEKIISYINVRLDEIEELYNIDALDDNKLEKLEKRYKNNIELIKEQIKKLDRHIYNFKHVYNLSRKMNNELNKIKKAYKHGHLTKKEYKEKSQQVSNKYTDKISLKKPYGDNVAN